MGRLDPRCEVSGCRYIAVTGQAVCVQHGGSPSTRPGTDAPVDHMRLCGARRRDGGTCRQPARRGQERCRVHGGSAPQTLRRADERITEAKAVELAQRHGIPRPIAAVDALQEELARTQGRIDWLQAEVDRRPGDPSLLAVYTAERNHLRQLAAGMVTAKTDERRAVLTERQIDVIEAAVTATLREFDLDPTCDAVRRTFARLLAVAQGAAQPAAIVQAAASPYAAGWPKPEPVAF